MSTLPLQNTDRDDNSSHRVGGRLGGLETRLALSDSEIRSAQRVRYNVFCEEMSANTGGLDRHGGLEQDGHDFHCEHLLVIDSEVTDSSGIVGTQRFLTQYGYEPSERFYSSGEFDIAPLLNRHPEKRFMELGRSCISPEYRSKRTMELLWHGTWDYALKNRVDVMFGCASFPTTDVSKIASGLAFLLDANPCAGDWDVLSNRPDAVDIEELEKPGTDQRRSLRALPPLIKGYLRLGAMFSRHAVRDRAFGTTDIMVVLPVTSINPKYIAHYGVSADRHGL